MKFLFINFYYIKKFYNYYIFILKLKIGNNNYKFKNYN